MCPKEAIEFKVSGLYVNIWDRKGFTVAGKDLLDVHTAVYYTDPRSLSEALKLHPGQSYNYCPQM